MENKQISSIFVSIYVLQIAMSVFPSLPANGKQSQDAEISGTNEVKKVFSFTNFPC